MENIAHSLLGARIADLGWKERMGPRATWIGVIAANLPDGDLLYSLVDADRGRWYHRGLTHSFFGWPIMALLGAAVSRRVLGQGSYRDHLGLWAACLLSHAMLDWPTTWGTLLFFPVSDVRFSLDWIFIVDPMFWAILGGLAWRRRGVARGAIPIAILAGWMLFGGMMKQQAIAQAPEKVEAWPAPLAPVFWTAVHTDSLTTRRYFLTPWSSTPAGSWPTPAGANVDVVRRTRRGERWFWMANAPVLRGEGRDGSVTLSDLAYTSWVDPDTFRFTVTLMPDGSERADGE